MHQGAGYDERVASHRTIVGAAVSLLSSRKAQQLVRTARRSCGRSWYGVVDHDWRTDRKRSTLISARPTDEARSSLFGCVAETVTHPIRLENEVCTPDR